SARRLNPYVAGHAEPFPDLLRFVQAIDAEVSADGGSANRAALEQEEEVEALSEAEMETLVRRFRFSRAADSYARYAATLKSPARKRQAEQRLGEIRAMSEAFARLCERLNAGKIADLKVRVARTEVTIVKALDEESFEYTFKQGGGKGTWPALGPESLLRFMERAEPPSEQRLGMGVLAFDLGLHDRGVELVSKAIQQDASLKPRLDAYVARQRGIDAPPGGFVLHQKRFVTPDEKANLEKGLVLFEGQWVTKSDREKLAKGLTKIGDKWVPREEKALLALGYRKYKGQWYSQEDYLALRSKWEGAFEEKTTHYDVRTNKGEEFARELAMLIEATYAGRDHPERLKAEYEFLSYVESVVRMGGLAVVAAFAVGRTQEILMTLAKKKFDVFLAGMGKDVNSIYVEHHGYVRSTKRLRQAMNRTRVVHSSRDHERALGAEVIVTTSGMLDGGPVLRYMSAIQDDPNSALCLTGFQVPGTNGRRLMDEGVVEIDGVLVQPQFQLRKFDFSAHAGHSQLVEFIEACDPTRVVLMHGDNRQALADALQGPEVLLPFEGQWYPIQ
ncbi:MAG: MBL fold metallo-hydrolase, partial [Candidatus Thermoplasmatota archaeon]